MATTAGSVTVDTTGENVFNDSKGCQCIIISVPSTSTSNALINIPGLHDSGDFFPVVKGKDYEFCVRGSIGIKTVFAKGDGGNATVNIAASLR